MKNIAIICGGFSGEYEISTQSANMVKQNLNDTKYSSYIVIIERNSWHYFDDNNNKHQINKNDFSIEIDNHKITFDGVFNAIHGSPGEDGGILGYFDSLNIPYTSCDMDVSALTFNKYLCNNFVKSLGIEVANSLSFVAGEKINKEKVIEILGLPLFIKPARSGSSVGVSKVSLIGEFDKAVENAYKADDRIIIEEFIDGREIDCGLFMNKNKLNILPLTEIKTNNEFFDYEAKYTTGKAEEITPPVDLNIEYETDIKAVSSFIYYQLGCKGIVRIDYILTSNQLYFIEINTVPGLSEASIVPKQAKAMGISISALFNITVANMFV